MAHSAFNSDQEVFTWLLVWKAQETQEEATRSSLHFTIAERRNPMHPYIMPFIPLPTSAPSQFTLTHPDLP